MAKRMLFILSTAGKGGTGGLAPALAQATVAAAMDVEVELVFTGDAGGLLLDNRLDDTLPDGSGRAVREAVEQARSLGVRLLLCSPVLARFGPEPERHVDGVVGAAWLVNESLRDDTVVLSY